MYTMITIIFLFTMKGFFKKMLSLIKDFRKLLRKPKPVVGLFSMEGFMEMLLRQQEGLTTPAENRYIREECRRNPEAVSLRADVYATFPYKRSYSYRRACMRVAAVFFASLFLAAGIYAFNRYFKISIEPRKQETSDLQRKPLIEVAKIIERTYARKVIFEREDIKNTPYNGKIDTTGSIVEVLSDLRFIDVKYFIDENGDVHLK